MDFAGSDPFSVGIEEELLLVDGDTLQLAHTSEAVAERIVARAGAVHLEWYASMIELTSAPYPDVPAAAAELRELRAELFRSGAQAIGAGVHPDGRLGDVEMVPRERFAEVAERLGRIVFRTPEAALHVHVGLPDAETAIRAFNGMREHLPMLRALAANSPFAFGDDSGYASARTILNRSYPRLDMPPSFRDYDEYTQAVERLAEAAEIDDYTLVWWDLRPHPRLGTLEVRVMDSQSSLDAVAGIAALIHGLTRQAAEAWAGEPTAREVIAESQYRASRLGMDAVLWSAGALRPARELVADALAQAAPHARELGSDAALEEVERLVRDGGGAARQRRAHAELGMRGLLEHLRDETASAGFRARLDSPGRQQGQLSSERG